MLLHVKTMSSHYRLAGSGNEMYPSVRSSSPPTTPYRCERANFGLVISLTDSAVRLLRSPGLGLDSWGETSFRDPVDDIAVDSNYGIQFWSSFESGCVARVASPGTNAGFFGASRSSNVAVGASKGARRCAFHQLVPPSDAHGRGRFDSGSQRTSKRTEP